MKLIHNNFGTIPIHTVSTNDDSSEKQRDILFIHMSWGGTWAFKFYIPFFAEAGYRVHALDLRGHGESGGSVKGTSMQDYTDDVRSAVTGLNLENPIIIGHSMGGLVALQYASQFGSSATISLDGSPSLEVQKTSEEKTYPASYTPMDSGMPTNPLQTMMALPDIYPWRLMKMKKMLKVESGVARSDRKRGISVPRESLQMPLFFVGAEKGISLPFGIGIEKARAQAEYYESPVVEIKGATHPGLLIGKHWNKSAEAVLEFLKQKNL